MDTIVALASGAGRSGVAVVRVSGPAVRFVLETMIGTVPAPRRATVRAVRSRSGDLIDEGVVLFFPGPASFTGEDVCEFQVHGSPAVVRRLVQDIVACREDLRPAARGEFTQRAFRNGRIDLTQAEALGMLIDSDTERQRAAALASLHDGLTRLVQDWARDLTGVLAEVEASIDFSDEGDVAEVLDAGTTESLRQLSERLLALGRQAIASRRLRDGLSVVIAGPPNAGKSSLLNALVAREAAIVSAHPGTTRDLIEAHVDLDGLPVRLIDGAGLRDTDDAVEAEGVRRAILAIQQADIVIWLGDDESPREDSIRVRSKSDLKASMRGRDGLSVSALTGDGLPELRSAIMAKADSLLPDGFAVTDRQASELERASQHLTAACAAGLPEELVAAEIRSCLRALERIIGRVGVEDVLGEVFARFCIGK